MSIVTRRVGPHISSAEPRQTGEGISSVLQASQKLRGVGEMCELEASGDVDLHNTLPLSLLVYSLSLTVCVSLPLVSDLQE